MESSDSRTDNDAAAPRLCRLPGDFGFDPLGLGKDPAFLKWYREAELIHGRWAMAAVLGIFVGQAWSGIPWFEAGADPGAIASYPDIGKFAFGSAARRAIAVFMYVELYLVAISFLVLEGDNLDKLFPGSSVQLMGGYRLQGKQASSCSSRWPPPSCCPPRGSRTLACSPTSRRSGSSRRRS